MARRRTAAEGYQAVRIDDFSGGLNTDHPATIGDNELTVARNVEFTSEGKPRPRPGVRKRFAADFDAAPVKGIGAYYKSDGTTRLVMAAGTALYADKPHVVFDYDSQAGWEGSGVYTNLDTKSSPGDVKLYTPPQATFLGTPTFDKMWI